VGGLVLGCRSFRASLVWSGGARSLFRSHNSLSEATSFATAGVCFAPAKGVLLEGEELGNNIKKLRGEMQISQAELARRAEVSAAYLSELESGQGRSPSGRVLLQLARALGTTIAVVLGDDVHPGDTSATPDPTLLAFARERGLSQADLDMLASIRFRGDPPKTSRRWAMIYDSIITSKMLDEH
jgi:transcriptional regulator with XRE-family HTH domain